MARLTSTNKASDGELTVTVMVLERPTDTAQDLGQLDRCQQQRVLLVEEHELLLAGLRSVLMDQPWVSSCFVATSAESAWQVAQRYKPQLVLVSTSLGGRTGIDLCRAFKARMPYVRVFLMTGEGRVSAALGLLHGAAGALSKQMPTAALVAALERVAGGARIFPKAATSAGTRLSARELDVLQQLSSGLSNVEVAASLNLSRHT